MSSVMRIKMRFASHTRNFDNDGKCVQEQIQLQVVQPAAMPGTPPQLQAFSGGNLSVNIVGKDEVGKIEGTTFWVDLTPAE